MLIKIEEHFLIHTESHALSSFQNVKFNLCMVRVMRENLTDTVLIESNMHRPGSITQNTFFPLHRMNEAIEHHRGMARQWGTYLARRDVVKQEAPALLRELILPTFKQVNTPEEALAMHDGHFEMGEYNPDEWIREVAPHFKHVFKVDVTEQLYHTDKAFQYRDQWVEAGIEYRIGVLLYLMGFCEPYSHSVRQTDDGFVDPGDWVVEQFKESRMVQRFLVERSAGQRLVAIYWRDGKYQEVYTGLTETTQEVFARMGYGGGAVSAVDWIDNEIVNYASPQTHYWMEKKKLDLVVAGAQQYKPGYWYPKEPIKL